MRSTARISAAILAMVVVAGTSLFVSPAVAHAATVRELQWYLDALRIPQAHKLSKGRGVTVAVIGGGVDTTHPALKGRVLKGHGIGSDAAPDGHRDSDAKSGHTTGMAGIIAGIGGSDMQQLGIAPEAKILPVSMGAEFDDNELVEAIRWAVDHGADVISLSLGVAGAATEGQVAAVRHALNKNVVVVASAGNTTQSGYAVAAPASIPGVIAVTGTAKDGRFLADSVEGPEAVLSAPMQDIISPRPLSASHNGYGVSTGTSDAGAIVSGVVALVRARFPDLDAANVINRLIVTAQDKGPQGRDSRYGFGVVDPVAALTAQVTPVEANPLLPVTAEDEVGEQRQRRSGDGPLIEISVTRNPVAWVLQIGLCLLAVAVVVFLIVVNRRAARRRAGARSVGSPPASYAMPPGPQPPPAAPWGNPPGHRQPWQGQSPPGNDTRQ
ncbi:MAG TPA: S8 family serine peptidase [Micromonospora sp.]|nr:S8 family serine peptidase [Micromonospora sp.]